MCQWKYTSKNKEHLNKKIQEKLKTLKTKVNSFWEANSTCILCSHILDSGSTTKVSSHFCWLGNITHLDTKHSHIPCCHSQSSQVRHWLQTPPWWRCCWCDWKCHERTCHNPYCRENEGFYDASWAQFTFSMWYLRSEYLTCDTDERSLLPGKYRWGRWMWTAPGRPGKHSKVVNRMIWWLTSQCGFNHMWKSKLLALVAPMLAHKSVTFLFPFQSSKNETLRWQMWCWVTHPCAITHPGENHIGALITIKSCLCEKHRRETYTQTQAHTHTHSHLKAAHSPPPQRLKWHVCQMGLKCWWISCLCWCH